MKKSTLLVAALACGVGAFAATPATVSSGSAVAASYAKTYLEIVYPTSPQIAKMSDAQAYNYYSHLNFWYRIPVGNYMTGIFNPTITPQYHVFLFPDTCMRTQTAQDKHSVNGFTTSKVIEGSNKDYIEVSSFGWMMFPYGAYFNWAKGSGMYLYTGGKTIAGYNKVTVIYKVYKQEGKLPEFYSKLGNTSAVRVQILGVDSPMTQAQYQTLTTMTSPSQWKTMPLDAAGHPYNPLAVGITYDKNWKEIQKKLISLKTPQNAYNYLVQIYVQDHNSGKYDQSQPRYQYFVGEANADIDAWMYTAVKAAGYNVIQMTLEPNSAGSPTFEICDVRWPKVAIPGMNPADLGQAAIEGLQANNLKYMWQKSIQNGWIQVRNPFDLMNNKESRNIVMQYPANDPVDASKIVAPPATFPTSWLPADGWGLAQAQKDGYISTDSFTKWVVPSPAPAPLQIPEKNNMGSFIKFGVNDVVNGGFSSTELAENIQLFNSKL